MATIRTITWQLPTVGARQRPLAHTDVDYRVKSELSLPWTLQDRIAADVEQKLVINDPAPGTFEYRFTAFDVDGRSSKTPPIVEKSADHDGPGDIGNVQIVDTVV